MMIHDTFLLKAKCVFDFNWFRYHNRKLFTQVLALWSARPQIINQRIKIDNEQRTTTKMIITVEKKEKKIKPNMNLIRFTRR